MDRGAQWATDHGVTKSGTVLSGKKNHHHASSVLFHLLQLKLYTHLTFLSPVQKDQWELT